MKYRKALLSSEVEKKIKEISEQISERYEIEFEKIGCDVNHIHVLCSFAAGHGEPKARASSLGLGCDFSNKNEVRLENL